MSFSLHADLDNNTTASELPEPLQDLEGGEPTDITAAVQTQSADSDESFHSAPNSPIIAATLLQRPRTEPHQSSTASFYSSLSLTMSTSPSQAFDGRQFVIPLPPKHHTVPRRKSFKSHFQALPSEPCQRRRNAASEPSSPTFLATFNHESDLLYSTEFLLDDGGKVSRAVSKTRDHEQQNNASDSKNAHPLTLEEEDEEEMELCDYEDADDLNLFSDAHDSDDEPLRSTVEGEQEFAPCRSTFSWSVATQKGYRYADGMSRDRKFDIHTEMEDMHYPSCGDSPNHIHPITGEPFQLFMLADGHGGHECALFAIQNLPRAIIALVSSRVWNFNDKTDRHDFETQLQGLCIEFDDEYCKHKLEQFRKWIQRRIQVHSSPLDPASRADKPSDDGCTLVINLLYDGFIVNANLGDSRTLILAKESEKSAWSPVFASMDHTPGHPERALQIHTNGGRFILNGYTAAVQDLLADGAETPRTADGSIEFLSRCRIGRLLGWRIDEINFPSCTTLNLSGTLGDMFFKYTPALISSKPDVSYIRLDMDRSKYIMVMASDGLWDHMAHQNPDVQHAMISSYVDSTMNHADTGSCAFLMKSSFGKDASVTSPAENESSENDAVHGKLRKLGILAHGMADREMVSCESKLYLPGFLRYDDVTVFVVLIEGNTE